MEPIFAVALVFMKILVSGFKPFLNDSINPSQLLALELKEIFPQIRVVILPVEFGTAYEILKEEIQHYKTELVFMLGQASGRKNICIEKVALNWIHTLNPDENGLRPISGMIQPQSDLALMSNCPVETWFESLKSLGHSIEISFSAGTYVCNELYYKTLSEFKTIKSLFIHLPLLPRQVEGLPNVFSLPYEKQLHLLKDLIQGRLDESL